MQMFSAVHLGKLDCNLSRLFILTPFRPLPFVSSFSTSQVKVFVLSLSIRLSGTFV